MISLNEAYANDTLYYWCNSCGEINYPGSGITSADEERLPAKVREVYDSFQFTPCGSNDIHVYTVTYNGVDGMLLMELFRYDKSVKMKLAGILKRTAKELSKRCEPWGTVLIGLDTDPAGHELGVFVPAESCAEHYSEAGKLLCEFSYAVDLQNAMRTNEHACRLAFSLLMQEGKQKFTGMSEKDIENELEPSVFDGEDLASIAKAVFSLAGTESDEVFSAIQQFSSPDDESDLEDICPLCGAEIDYLGDRDLDDNGTHVSWECPHCKATGVAQYADRFLFHNNVRDAEGKLVEEVN